MPSAELNLVVVGIKKKAVKERKTKKQVNI
jgi:hypothetical protein